MNAIRKILKREGNQITFELPEDFRAENVELIILPAEDQQDEKAMSVEKPLAEKAREFYKDFNTDLSNYKFNREELYDRP